MADNNQRRSRNNNRPEPEVKEFDERVVHIDRVASVAEGGRRFHFRALVAVGDHKGRVGIGVAKGVDVTSAVNKAVGIAKKSLINVNLYKDTIPHDSQASSGGSDILIKPASPGTGLIAGGVSRTILEVAGVRNALSKSLGSNNKINSARATIFALDSLVPAKDWITRLSRTPTSHKPVAKKVEATAEKPTIVEKEAKTSPKKTAVVKKAVKATPKTPTTAKKKVATTKPGAKK
jgi:small subunit ribosomal protein S5